MNEGRERERQREREREGEAAKWLWKSSGSRMRKEGRRDETKATSAEGRRDRGGRGSHPIGKEGEGGSRSDYNMARLAGRGAFLFLWYREIAGAM